MLKVIVKTSIKKKLTKYLLKGLYSEKFHVSDF